MTTRPPKSDSLRRERAWAKAHPHSVKTTRYKIVTPTLRRLEKAAMRWYRDFLGCGWIANYFERTDHPSKYLFLAAAAHAKAKSGRRTK